MKTITKSRLRCLRWFGPSCSQSCWSRQWPYSRLSLFASGITTGRAKRLPAIPFLRLRCRACDFILPIIRADRRVRFREQTGKHTLVLSLTGSYPSGHLFARLAYRP